MHSLYMSFLYNPPVAVEKERLVSPARQESEPMKMRPMHLSEMIGQDRVRESVFQLARKYPRLDHLTAALVGPPYPRLALQRLRRNHRRAGSAHNLFRMRILEHCTGS